MKLVKDLVLIVVVSALIIGVVNCSRSVEANWDHPQTDPITPTQAPVPIKPIPFNSMPVLMSDGIIICEDGSMWAVVKSGNQLLVEQMTPAMEVEDE